MQFRGLTLDPFQEQAITWLLGGTSVLVCAPTGTGKTIVADAVVDQAMERGQRVIYTAPVKALSNQKFRDYCKLHGEDKVGLVTGDLVIRRDAPCVVMTTEILRNMLLSGEPLDDLAAVVLDEIHFLDDRDRGTVWEEVLIYLPASVVILGLSATLSNVREFASWLTEVRGSKVEVVEEHTRAVPLEIWLANSKVGAIAPAQFEHAFGRWKRQQPRGKGRDKRGRNGRGGHRNKGPRTSHLRMVDLVEGAQGLPLLYFVFSRKLTEQYARRLGEEVQGSLVPEADREALDAKLTEATEVVSHAVLEPELVALYRKGVAFHHAGLHVQLKALVEELYERKLLRVLYTTSTFALGINMPARTVVLDGLEKYDGRGINPLSVRGFMQKAGRAGRRGMDDVGNVLVRMDFQDYGKVREHLSRYLEARPEEVRSSFNLSFNSVVNLIDQHGTHACRPIVEKSFMAYRLNARSRELNGQVKRIKQQIKDRGGDPESITRGPAPKDRQLRQLSRELGQLTKRMSAGQGRVWRDFQRRRNFLVEVGYLEPDDTLLVGAKVLRHIQIEEILTTELVLEGILEELDGDQIFGVLCAMTNRMPKGVHLRAKPTGETRRIAREITDLRLGRVVGSAEAITGVEVTWSPEFLELGQRWSRGESLDTIQSLYDSPVDISGQMVGGFRRAKDLAGQLKEAHRGDERMVTLLRDLVRRVSRDEVEVVG
jgi:superfamily II RNA helicase